MGAIFDVINILVILPAIQNPTCIFRYDHPLILAGQGTLALEIMEQVQNIDAVIIPVGGGGLIAGAALAFKTLKPEIQIIVSNIRTKSYLLIN
jgi:threonine dehydratase